MYSAFWYLIMKEIIVEYVRSLGVRLSLGAHKCTGLLTYYIFDWMGTDSKFYSFLVICNETQFFTKNVLRLGDEEGGALSRLNVNLRSFSKKQEWVEGKWTEDAIKKYDAFLKEEISTIKIVNCDTLHYSVIGFCICLHPIVQYVITYRTNHDIKNLVLSLGASKNIEVESLEQKEFFENILEQLDLNNKYLIEVKEDELYT